MVSNGNILLVVGSTELGIRVELVDCEAANPARKHNSRWMGSMAVDMSKADWRMEVNYGSINGIYALSDNDCDER